MKIQCPNCNETTELTFEVDWKNFACPHCQTLYSKDQNGDPKQLKFLPKTYLILSLFVGQQGVLEGVLWEVGSICIKKPVNPSYGWQEYTLYSAKGNVCFLSEYDGHWLLAKEIETGETFDIDASHETGFGIEYKNEQYAIYNCTEKYLTEYAAGIFDHPVPTKGKAKDFVKLPHALLLEKNDEEATFAFEARHISQKELTAAFPEIILPGQYGQGMLQPFPINVSSFGTILAAFGGIALLCQLFLTGFYPSYPVLNSYVLLPDTVAEVTHVSPSFTCTGMLAPLKIELSAPVNNSWAAVDFCLVNEETKEERYGTVDVALYNGIEDGERWSEGDSRPSIKICGVPPGPYHLVMQITKKPNTPDLKSLRYSVLARSFSIVNLIWVFGVLIIAGLIVFFWSYHFEQKRWMNSDFAPETEED